MRAGHPRSSGTHGRGVLRRFSKDMAASSLQIYELPNTVALDKSIYKVVTQALWRQNGGWIGRLVGELRWHQTFLRARVGHRK